MERSLALKIVDLVPAAGVVFRLTADDAVGVVDELAAALARVHSLDASRVRTVLQEREQLGSTAIGNGIAAPHARMEVAHTVGILGVAERGIDFGAADGEPVRLFVAFVSPRQGAAHLKALAAVAQTLGDAKMREALLHAKSAAELHQLLARTSG